MELGEDVAYTAGVVEMPARKGRAACEAAATAAAIATLRFASEKLLENKGDPGPGRTVKGDPQDAGCVKPMRSPCWAFAQL